MMEMAVETVEKQYVFSGKPAYANKRLKELRNSGYRIVRSREWPDGSTTYVMAYPVSTGVKNGQ